MKKLFIAALLLTTLTISCKKDDNNNNSSSSATGSLTATNYGFDTNASLGKFSSTKASITQVTSGGATTFTVTALKDGSNEAIILTLLQPVTATGTIAVGTAVNNGNIVISKDNTKAADLTLNYSTNRRSPTGNGTGGGSISITKIDGKKVEGTFYAVAYNSAGASAYAENGVFSGTIQ